MFESPAKRNLILLARCRIFMQREKSESERERVGLCWCLWVLVDGAKNKEADHGGRELNGRGSLSFPFLFCFFSLFNF